MKICILSNSHAAALKNGWDGLSVNYPDIELTFFASRQKGLAGLDLQDCNLIPNNEALLKDISYTSNGSKLIDLNAYDLFLIYGFLRVPQFDLRYSHACIRQANLDSFNLSLGGKLYRLIRQVTQKPIFIGLVSNPVFYAHKKNRENKLTYSHSLKFLEEAIVASNLLLIPQPEESLIDNWYTDHKYCIGSKRLDVGDKISKKEHPPHEKIAHMNEEFGQAWLENFLKILDESSFRKGR
jgi:hypothetical protein